MSNKKNNLTNLCLACGKPCSRNAARCERCARPNRMPQRKDIGITLTSSNVGRVMEKAQERVNQKPYAAT